MDSDIPPASPQSQPDVMNDPAYQTNLKGKSKGTEEPDTCRICRGEGSKEEPLFYPCKCSGSIKFVHQACLMEWLSHSQKKHCELCKTSFRFTKLYHPQMPSTVPLPIFLRQAAIHTLKSFVTWARWHLVVFVWLGWVPWCMRTVWRGLFWVGDGGWINWQQMEKQAALGAMTTEQLAPQGTSAASRGLMSAKDMATSNPTLKVSIFSNILPPFRPPIFQTLNFTAGDPTLFQFAKRVFRGVFYYGSVIPASLNDTKPSNATTFAGSSQRSPSWLSDISFLRRLTRWTTFNNMIIDVLEGQLITLFVVIAFILIFLIREWVVQQQPAINMGAAFAAAAAVERPREENVPPLRLEDRQDQQAPPETRELNLPGDAPDADNEEASEARAVREARMMARPRARRPVRFEQPEEHPEGYARFLDEYSPTQGSSRLSSSPSGTTEMQNQSTTSAGPSNNNHRPSMPTRDVLATATEIRRTLEEHPRTVPHNWPGLEVFMDLWRRADHNPANVLKIIDEEGRSEELGWVVAVMDRLIKNSIDGSSNTEVHNVDEAFAQIDVENTGEQSSNTSNESWQVIEGSSGSSTGQTLSTADESTMPRTSSFEELTNENDTSPADTVTPPSASSVPARMSAHKYDKGKARWPRPRTSKDAGVEISVTDHSQPSRSSTGNSILLPPSEKFPEHDEVPMAKLLGISPFTPAPPHGRDEYFHDLPESPTFESQPESASTDVPSAEFIATEPTAVEPVAADSEPAAMEPPAAVHEPRGIRETMIDWLWGGVAQQEVRDEEPGEDDEHVIRDAAAEDPFVPVVQGQLQIEDANARDNGGEDPEVAGAAAQAGIDLNDPEAIEDGEDLEGIMELIGMQGPLAGLVQNGMFCAVLISLTVFFGIWIPYIAGKLFLVFLANPISLLVKLPLRWASVTADLIIDTCVFCAACAFYWVDTAVGLAVTPVGWLVPFLARLNRSRPLSRAAWNYAHSAGDRLVKMFVATGEGLSDSDIPVFSIIAHESLNTIEQYFADAGKALLAASRSVAESCSGNTLDLGTTATFVADSFVNNCKALYTGLMIAVRQTIALIPAVLNINPLRISLDIPQRTRPLDFSLAQWSTRDRVITILLGYLFFFVAGAIYLRIRSALHTAQEGEKTEGSVADVLYQAGGVLKVILIISIEMIVFPLYCGLLLDFALLPLFENATALTRFQFTITSPATSLFVHWFVGTCYMFHFALFVAMCRKILRSGVLHFIRDPDDPTFHPVRDVLERSVSTQLRKIAFSALVYGALVIICLGSVVWGLSYSIGGVFPIHWSSNEPVLEFPIDLLVYNFLMPLAVRFFTPSKGLKFIYEWWFKKCARMLRLSHFLFDKKMDDEEGHFTHRRWRDILSFHGKPTTEAIKEKEAEPTSSNQLTFPNFIKSGRYVRAPASDQVRIPKGARTFVEVDASGRRTDGLPDTTHGLHGRENKQFTTLYVPPHFRIRIGLFILLIWLFAAMTGLSLTVIPLLVGRRIFTHLIPAHQRMNDIYAFSIGIYVLGLPIYLLIRLSPRHLSLPLHLRIRWDNQHLSHPHLPSTKTLRNAIRTSTLHLLRLTYFYSTTLLLLPSLLAALTELYLLLPLHTYLSPTPPRHTIHAIQSWTLGVLTLKAFTRLILAHATSRPAQALRAIVAPPHGWLDPDVRLATRAFIFPGVLVMSAAIGLPAGVAWGVDKLGVWDIEVRANVYRYAYPACLAAGLGVVAAVGGMRAVSGWRRRVRDEVYLVGERLHNFGERKGKV